MSVSVPQHIRDPVQSDEACRTCRYLGNLDPTDFGASLKSFKPLGLAKAVNADGQPAADRSFLVYSLPPSISALVLQDRKARDRFGSQGLPKRHEWSFLPGKKRKFTPGFEPLPAGKSFTCGEANSRNLIATGIFGQFGGKLSPDQEYAGKNRQGVVMQCVLAGKVVPFTKSNRIQTTSIKGGNSNSSQDKRPYKAPREEGIVRIVWRMVRLEENRRRRRRHDDDDHDAPSLTMSRFYPKPPPRNSPTLLLALSLDKIAGLMDIHMDARQCNATLVAQSVYYRCSDSEVRLAARSPTPFNSRRLSVPAGKSGSLRRRSHSIGGVGATAGSINLALPALSGNRRGRDARHRRPINDARHGERAVFLAPLDIRVRRASHGAPGTSVVAGGGGARTSGAIQRHSWGVGRGTLHSFFPTSHVYPISYDIRIGVAGPSPAPAPVPAADAPSRSRSHAHFTPMRTHPPRASRGVHPRLDGTVVVRSPRRPWGSGGVIRRPGIAYRFMDRVRRANMSRRTKCRARDDARLKSVDDAPCTGEIARIEPTLERLSLLNEPHYCEYCQDFPEPVWKQILETCTEEQSYED
ncbi:hypothetical protein B0H11DRAFT_2380053 [Mycena galericulata]|nr:hypothetical protein B0H11DRAFT_2380053 [Mycena galericulata]